MLGNKLLENLKHIDCDDDAKVAIKFWLFKSREKPQRKPLQINTLGYEIKEVIDKNGQVNYIPQNKR